jgi:glutamate:GABA antiporter
MAESSSSLPPDAMLAEVVPPRILPRVLSRFDMVSIYFALIFGSYGAAQMAAQGWAGISMILLAAVTFLVPCILASYELGTLFPAEGGVYVWAHKTFGPLHGFIAGWLGWVPIFLLLPLGATTIVAHLQLVLQSEWPLWGQVAAQIGIVVVIGGVSLAKLSVSQRYVRWMFWVSLGSAAAVFLAALALGRSANPVDSEILSLDLSKYGSLYSAAILWVLGVEVPFNMGAEFGDHRRTARTMFSWGSLALVAGYLMGIAGILMLIPVKSVDTTTGVARAAFSVSPVFGVLIGLAICFAVASQDVTYMNSYSRLLFISGIERRLPAVFAQVSEKTKVPAPALLLQVAGAIVVLLVFSSQTQLAVAFNLYLASLVAVWCVSLFYLFAGLVRARMIFAAKYEQQGEAGWRIPGGWFGAWVVAVWGGVANCAAIWYVFALPWTADVSVHVWRTWLAGISLAIIASGFIIYRSGQGRVKSGALAEELRKYATFDPPQP